MPSREGLDELARMAIATGAYDHAATYLLVLLSNNGDFNTAERNDFAEVYLRAAKEMEGKLAGIDAYRESPGNNYQIIDVME